MKYEFNRNQLVSKAVFILVLATMWTPAVSLAQESDDRVKYELFKGIETAMQRAKQEDVPTFAPTLFAKATEFERRAEGGYEKGERLKEIRKRLRQAMETLNQASEATHVSKVALAKILEIRRQVATFKFISKLAPNKFNQAERRYRQAVLLAEEGKIHSARKKWDGALKKYREATIQALQKGSIKDAAKRLRESKETIPPKNYTKAAYELKDLLDDLQKLKKKDFEIQAKCKMVLSKINDIESGYTNSNSISEYDERLIHKLLDSKTETGLYHDGQVAGKKMTNNSSKTQNMQNGETSTISQFPVNLGAGVTVTFETTALSSGCDPVLHLIDTSSGIEVAFDDNSGQGKAARLTYTPRQNAKYLLTVRSRNENSKGTCNLQMNGTLRRTRVRVQ